MDKLVPNEGPLAPRHRCVGVAQETAHLCYITMSCQ